jgi:hypothetical protein
VTPPDVRARARGTGRGGPRPRADPLACPRFLAGTSPLYLERCIPAVLPRARARRGPGASAHHGASSARGVDRGRVADDPRGETANRAPAKAHP